MTENAVEGGKSQIYDRLNSIGTQPDFIIGDRSMLTSVPATISSVPATIPSLLASRRPGHSLPAGLYTEQDVFDADMKVFFGRHWILVGLACEIPEPGDALTLDIGRASVILVRDDDMSVRAFHNAVALAAPASSMPGRPSSPGWSARTTSGPTRPAGSHPALCVSMVLPVVAVVARVGLE